jgi:predicted ArsR family transcriptional regulator
MQATRRKIIEYLHRNGEATIRDLAKTVGLTATGVRQHLATLAREGLVAAEETHGKIGRPALVYSLTAAGAALFPSRYDDLSNLLLEQIKTIAGSQGLQTVLMRVAARSAEPYERRVQNRTLPDRVAEAAAIINERGSVADFAAAADGAYLIHQHTCPFPNVAKANSGVCALEVEFVRRLTGADTRLVRSLLRGDNTCTYRVRGGLESPHSRAT